MSSAILHDETSLQPLTPSQVYDPTYWRERAAQTRRMASGAPTAKVASMMERAALDFDRLAERAAALREADAA